MSVSGAAPAALKSSQQPRAAGLQRALDPWRVRAASSVVWRARARSPTQPTNRKEEPWRCTNNPHANDPDGPRPFITSVMTSAGPSRAGATSRGRSDVSQRRSFLLAPPGSSMPTMRYAPWPMCWWTSWLGSGCVRVRTRTQPDPALLQRRLMANDGIARGLALSTYSPNWGATWAIAAILAAAVSASYSSRRAWKVSSRNSTVISGLALRL